MDLHLVDGNLEHPLGMLENVLVESCGVKYEHSFALVIFGQDQSYKVILGRPFMRQLQVIQGWGFDYLYLHHDDAMTRVNLVDYTYKDVIMTPVDDFDSFSSGLTPNLVDSSGIWRTLGYFKTLLKKFWLWIVDNALMEKDYVSSPFPEHLMDDHK